MKCRLIAAVTAAALALTTATATPAMADDRSRDALKVLLGAAAIGLIVNEVSKNKRKSQKSAVPVARDDYDDDRQYLYSRDRDWHRNDRGYGHHKHHGKHGHHARAIPSECVFAIRGHRGHRDVVSARCLREFGVARRLPGRCAFDIRSRWGDRTVYGAQCLRDYGFKIAKAYR